jgi:hypothetical protein
VVADSPRAICSPGRRGAHPSRRLTIGYRRSTGKLKAPDRQCVRAANAQAADGAPRWRLSRDELVARETNVSIARLGEWRQRALAGAATALKERERIPPEVPELAY